jgi:hypothetical protein
MPMTLERVEIAAEAMAGKAAVKDASEARDTMAESDPVAAEEDYVKPLINMDNSAAFKTDSRNEITNCNDYP